MSRGINKAIVMGNVGKKPEQRAMPDGTAVTNFSVATSSFWKDKQTGEQKEKTEWHRMVAFGKLAEVIGQYGDKGSKVYCEGEMTSRKYEQDGVEKYSHEIKLRDFQFLDSKGETSSSHQDRLPADDFDDDIPFS